MAADYPEGADRNVFRNLEELGFDFDVQHQIDFQIDFRSWPPDQEVFEILKNLKNVNAVTTHEPYSIEISIRESLTYDLVIIVQRELTEVMSPYGGYCDSWAVMHEPN